jgi:protein ImuA
MSRVAYVHARRPPVPNASPPCGRRCGRSNRRGAGARDCLPFGVDAIDRRLAGGGLAVPACTKWPAPARARRRCRRDLVPRRHRRRLAGRGGTVLWALSRRDLFAPGLALAGLSADRCSTPNAGRDEEVLAVMEEGLRHGGLAAVVGEVGRVAMASTRRLQLAAEEGGTMALMLKRWRKAARIRWPSPPPPSPAGGSPARRPQSCRWRASAARAGASNSPASAAANLSTLDHGGHRCRGSPRSTCRTSPSIAYREADPEGDAPSSPASPCSPPAAGLRAPPSRPDGLWLDLTGVAHLFGGEGGCAPHPRFCARARLHRPHRRRRHARRRPRARPLLRRAAHPLPAGREAEALAPSRSPRSASARTCSAPPAASGSSGSAISRHAARAAPAPLRQDLARPPRPGARRAPPSRSIRSCPKIRRPSLRFAEPIATAEAIGRRSADADGEARSDTLASGPRRPRLTLPATGSTARSSASPSAPPAPPATARISCASSP